MNRHAFGAFLRPTRLPDPPHRRPIRRATARSAAPPLDPPRHRPIRRATARSAAPPLDPPRRRPIRRAL